jgi:hypothetical protein
VYPPELDNVRPTCQLGPTEAHKNTKKGKTMMSAKILIAISASLLGSEIQAVSIDDLNAAQMIKAERLRFQEEENTLDETRQETHLFTPFELKEIQIKPLLKTQDVFRLIQSIPSKKAEPFKQWLAKVGQERIDEIENRATSRYLEEDRVSKQESHVRTLCHAGLVIVDRVSQGSTETISAHGCFSRRSQTNSERVCFCHRNRVMVGQSHVCRVEQALEALKEGPSLANSDLQTKGILKKCRQGHILEEKIEMLYFI